MENVQSSSAILLGIKNNFSLKTNKILQTVIGITFLLQGIYFSFLSDFLEPLNMILGILMIGFGIFSLLYSYYGFSEDSKYAPRFEVNEKELIIKLGLFKASTVFTWKDITQVDLGNFSIGISTSRGREYFNYSTQAETSKSIKSAVREMAESKGIQVLNG